MPEGHVAYVRGMIPVITASAYRCPVGSRIYACSKKKSMFAAPTRHHNVERPVSTASDPFFIELCAGSARVTTCLQFFGLKSSFGVDHKRQKSSGRLLTADLTTAEGQAVCEQWLASPNCVGIFAAPPCGTCSRARGIPIQLPCGKWIPGPKPLRTEELPDGVEHMTPIERTRVESANTLYAFVTKICLMCLSANKVVCIENPRSSLYWRTSFFAQGETDLHSA